MIITREQQMELLEEYSHNARNLDAVLGFSDGMVAAIKLVNKLLKEERESNIKTSHHPVFNDILKTFGA